MLVWLVTGLYAAFLLTYSFVYPTWTGYDEAQHVDMVVGLEHGDGWPAPGKRTISEGVARTSDAFDRGAYADFFLSDGKKRGDRSFAEITPTPRGQRQSFEAMGGDAPVTDGRLSNQMVQHPPLVYAAGAAVLKVLPGSSHWSYDESVWVLRLLNIVIMVPLPLLSWAAARRFGLSPPLAAAASIVPLAVPGMTRVGATFNNDGILTLSTGALTVVLAGVMRGDMRRRSAVLAAVCLGVALLSKAFALLLPLMVATAYVVGWRVARSRRWAPMLTAVVLGCALGGWWWVRNYVLYGAVQPNGWGTDPPRREPLLLPKSFLTWFWYFFRTMIARFWGGLGLFEPPTLSPLAIVPATVLVVVACGAVLARRRGAYAQPGSPLAELSDVGRGRLDRLASWGAPAVLLFPTAFACVMVGQRSYADYRIYARGIAVQGRYLYLGIVGLAVVTVLGIRRLVGPARGRLAPVFLLAGALVMQVVALVTVCSYYWLGRGVAFTPARLPDVVAAIARWAPFPYGFTVAPMLLAAVLAVGTLAWAVRDASRRRMPDGTVGGSRQA